MKIVFLILTIFVSLHIFGQEKEWPPREWKDSFYTVHAKYPITHTTRNFYGLIVLKNGDTLKGYIRPWIDYCEFLEYNKFTPITIYNDRINYIQGNLPNITGNFIIAKNLNRTKWLWRLLKQENNVLIYDSFDYTHLSSLGIPMFLSVNDSLIRISGISSMLYSDKNKLILNFINKRYNKSFQESDFKTPMEMINYILDKENERLNKNSS